MNEILKKRIELASKRFAHLNPMASAESVITFCRETFQEGAMYALASQWISVEEALPEPEEEVVLFNKNSIRHYEIGWLRKEKGYSKSKWAITNGFVEDDDITHWMPIPKFETKDKEDKQ